MKTVKYIDPSSGKITESKVLQVFDNGDVRTEKDGVRTKSELINKENLAKLWLEYYNDFLSTEKFAEYHLTDKKTMQSLLLEGKEAYKELKQ